MLHAVRLHGGKASYSNSYVETSRLKKESAVGHSVFSKASLTNPVSVVKARTGEGKYYTHLGKL